jgi:hypothetical protein
MKSSLCSFIAAAVLGLAVLPASPALAQRVFVAAQGSDANPCTFAAPCRTFQHAHDVVAAGGEIDVLDPAGYGTVNITKSISIQGHGFSGITASGNSVAITINAGATGVVNLNGLLIDGAGTGNTGIVVNGAKSLVVANSLVRRFAANAILFVAGSANAQTLSVSDSYLTENGSQGISIQTLSSGIVTAAVDRTGLYANDIGIKVDGSAGTGAINVALSDSVAGNSTGANGIGVSVTSASSPTSVVLTHTTAAGNNVGVQASGNKATLRLSESDITANGTGFSVAGGGSILSYGDNTIDDNATNTGALGSATKQ